MPAKRLTKFEMQIMETLWTKGELSIREMLEGFPETAMPGYSTIQTTVYRLEARGVVRRLRRVGNFHVFAANITRNMAQRRLVDDMLTLFGGRPEGVMTHLIESGNLTLNDVKELRKELSKMSKSK
jgi:predicted transcriptional regulator